MSYIPFCSARQSTRSLENAQGCIFISGAPLLSQANNLPDKEFYKKGFVMVKR
jgi:hypothetical protein